MPQPLTLEICRSLTLLTRQLLGADQPQVQTHVLAQGQVYRVAVVLEPIPADQINTVMQDYL